MKKKKKYENKIKFLFLKHVQQVEQNKKKKGKRNDVRVGKKSSRSGTLEVVVVVVGGGNNI